MKQELGRYWLRRGKRYSREFRRKSPEEKIRYRRQLDECSRALASLSGVGSVLELGCGFGRLTTIIRETFPSASITAVDLSRAQVRRAMKLLPRVEFLIGDVTALDLSRTFDLVVASEFYMHLPTEEFERVMDKVSIWARRSAMNVDYTGEGAVLPTKSGLEYQFRHDYVRAYSQRGFSKVLSLPIVGGQTIFVARKAITG